MNVDPRLHRVSLLAAAALALTAAAPSNPMSQADDAQPPPAPPPAFKKLPARSADEARQDPRFARRVPDSDARSRVTKILDAYPYYGIANNGCTQGAHFLTAELLGPFDDLPPGTVVILRIEDLTLGPAAVGATLAFSGLRRAGKGPDGTPVYCGRGSAFQIRQ